MEDPIKEKEFRDLTQKWNEEANMDNKPICLTCARFDFAKGRLQNKEHYMEGIKLKREYQAWKHEYSLKDPSVLVQFSEYTCPNNHGLCITKSLNKTSRNSSEPEEELPKTKKVK